MKIKDIMTLNPKVCTPTTDLAEAAHLMWDYDFGVLPVVTEGKVVGLITDRDICMAAAMKGRTLANIAVEEVITGKVYACKPEDEVTAALEIMRDRRIRRVPVLDDEGRLEGIVSMNDIALQAKPAGKKIDVSYDDVMRAYQSVCAHAGPTPQEVARMAASV